MPALPLGHTCPPPVIPVPHLSFPQGFSGNPESFMLENLNGGSMQPLTLALSLKGGFAKFPFSVIPAKPGPAIGDRGAGIQKKRPARPGHPKAGEWAGIPAGGSGAVRSRVPFLENSSGFPLKPAGMTEGASVAKKKKRPVRPGHPKAGEWAGIPTGVRVLFAPAGRFWKTPLDSRLNLRE